MKKIEPKFIKTTPQQETADLEATFNILKNKEKIAPEKPAQKSKKPGRPAKKRTVEAPAKRDGKTRLTIDLPTEIYEITQKHKEETGQNFTHLIVSLLRKHFNQTK